MFTLELPDLRIRLELRRIVGRMFERWGARWGGEFEMQFPAIDVRSGALDDCC